MENMDKRKFRNGMIIYLLILIVAFILINRWMQSDKIEVTTTYSYTDLTEDLDDGKILALSIQPNAEIPTAGGPGAVPHRNKLALFFSSSPTERLLHFIPQMSMMS